jgi:hypothetical protein
MSCCSNIRFSPSGNKRENLIQDIPSFYISTFDSSKSMSPNTNDKFYQGILYKRRDVFVHQWRPRWFILDQESRILTYHLLHKSYDPGCLTERSTLKRNQSQSRQIPSVDSQDGQKEYDVTPKGILYLRGCHVHLVDESTNPSDRIYSFSITFPDTLIKDTSPTNTYFLATTTAEERSEWISKLKKVCEESDHDNLFTSNELFCENSSAMEDCSQNEDPYLGDSADWCDDEPGKSTLGLESEVKMKIDSNLAHYMSYIDDEIDWNILFHDKEGLSSYQKDSMLKSVAILDHHPKQIFSLLANAYRRREYEKDVRHCERLKRYNDHTFLDYYAYNPVWPTSAREFLVLFHWRILRRQPNQKAIVLMAFSYPQAYEIKAVASDHVRATLNISLFLLELLEGNKTKATRIISYDLCGNIPKALSNSIQKQQAYLPIILSSFLRAKEGNRQVKGSISNASLVKELENQGKMDLDSVSQRQEFDSSFSSIANDNITACERLEDHEEIDAEIDESYSQLTTLLVILILLTPLVIYNFFEESFREAYFLVSSFMALRIVILLTLGTAMPQHFVPTTVTYRLSINLSGFLNFLAEKDKSNTSKNLSVLPFLVKSIAKALSEVDEMNSRKIDIPLLGISGYFFQREIPISVLWESKVDTQLFHITDVNQKTIETLSMELEESKAPSNKRHFGFLSPLVNFQNSPTGSCLIIVCPDIDNNEALDVKVSAHKHFNTTFVVGDIRFQKQERLKDSDSAIKFSSTPFLSLLVTMDNPCCSVTNCKYFVERIQELLEEINA